MASRVTVKKDDTAKVTKSLRELFGARVLVGIPESNDSRDGDSIGNAGIGYVMEFGSPANNVPARPWLVPGVKKAEKPATAQLQKAITAALNCDMTKMNQSLNAAGVIATNEVRVQINSDIPPPLKPGTIANRFRQRRGVRGVKSRRESEQVYLGLIAKGVDPGAAQAETGIQTLVNTAELRNAISYVIVKGANK